MKKLTLSLSFFLSVFSLPAMAARGQQVEIDILKKTGYAHDRSIVAPCNDIAVQIAGRLQTFIEYTHTLPAQEHLMDEQVDFKAQTVMVRNMHAKSDALRYTHYCRLTLTLVSDFYDVTFKDSTVKHKGRNRLDECNSEKYDIDMTPGTLFSRLHEGLFKCKVVNILGIEKE